MLWGACEAAEDSPARVTVKDTDGLRRALSRATPGTRIELAPGVYRGGLYVRKLRGERGKPIVISAANEKEPPVFKGGAVAMHLADPAHLELRRLTFTGQTGNGLNIDDGGSFDSPAHHIVLQGLTVTDIGPDGNRDGIKLSGVDDFRVEGCTIERWGKRGGSAIDMVGCHRGLIADSLFRHRHGVVGNTAVQAKGGTSEIVIRGNRFENAGGRAVNIGGSTGLRFFRPPLTAWDAPYCEARDIRVEGNTFIGGLAPVAFVGVDGSAVRFNTIYCPGRWAVRILQETRAQGFVPSRNGEFTDNIVAFRSDQWSEGGVNIGSRTAPTTFRFARNFWFCLDQPQQTRRLVGLPVSEPDGDYGRDPLFRDAAQGDLRLKPDSPAAGKGAEGGETN